MKLVTGDMSSEAKIPIHIGVVSYKLQDFMTVFTRNMLPVTRNHSHE